MRASPSRGVGDRRDHPAEWEPPPELCAFLRAGPPPVYVGFGSTGNTRASDSVIELVLNALKRAEHGDGRSDHSVAIQERGAEQACRN